MSAGKSEDLHNATVCLFVCVHVHCQSLGNERAKYDNTEPWQERKIVECWKYKWSYADGQKQFMCYPHGREEKLAHTDYYYCDSKAQCVVFRKYGKKSKTYSNAMQYAESNIGNGVPYICRDSNNQCAECNYAYAFPSSLHSTVFRELKTYAHE